MIESVVVWKWEKPGYRSTFTAHHVNTMRNMVRRHYPRDHRFICITDDPKGIDDDIEVVELWSQHGQLLNPTWPHVGPSCYRRLRAFSEEFEEIAGKRFVSIDLDCVITANLSPLWDRPEDFVVYDPLGNGAFNGSMWLMTTGCRSQVWDTFDPKKSPAISNAAGYHGSDQGWIRYVLGGDEAVWTRHHGVLGYKRDCLKKLGGGLPKNSRIVVFHGKPDPWMPVAIRQSPWIEDHYH